MKPATLLETGEGSIPAMDNGSREKKKRLTSTQIELLERSFQEDTKLDPERKMKLSRELNLQPRQIAVWFQNRRTRWKTKQLEHLYGVLKHQYDVISNEKQKLQEEVPNVSLHLHSHTNSKCLVAFTHILVSLHLPLNHILHIQRSLLFKFKCSDHLSPVLVMPKEQ